MKIASFFGQWFGNRPNCCGLHCFARLATLTDANCKNKAEEKKTLPPFVGLNNRTLYYSVYSLSFVSIALIIFAGLPPTIVIGGTIVCNHAVGTDDRTIADMYTGQNGSADANPHLVLYDNGTTVRGVAIVGIRIVVDGDKIHFRPMNTPSPIVIPPRSKKVQPC